MTDQPETLPCIQKALTKRQFPVPHGFQIKNGRVQLPKVGWVSFHKSRHKNDALKNVTILRQIDHWSVSIQVEMILEQSVHTTHKEVVIDVGVSILMAQSQGKYLLPINVFKKAEKKLAKLQWGLMPEVKSSSNWQKQIKKIQRLYWHIANMRNKYLQVKNMSKSVKGTLQNPGSNVKSKS